MYYEISDILTTTVSDMLNLLRASLTKAIAFSSFVSASLLSELAVQHEDTEVWRCSKLEGQDLNSLKYIVHMVIQKDV